MGAVVKPRRGSVALWWNMDTGGGYDLRTKHGGCPVMVGSKESSSYQFRVSEKVSGWKSSLSYDPFMINLSIFHSINLIYHLSIYLSFINLSIIYQSIQHQ